MQPKAFKANVNQFISTLIKDSKNRNYFLKSVAFNVVNTFDARLFNE